MSESYNLLFIDNLPAFLLWSRGVLFGKWVAGDGRGAGSLNIPFAVHVRIVQFDEIISLWKLHKLCRMWFKILAARVSEKYLHAEDFRDWKLQFLLLVLLLILECLTLIVRGPSSLLASFRKGTRLKIVFLGSNGRRWGGWDPPVVSSDLGSWQETRLYQEIKWERGFLMLPRDFRCCSWSCLLVNLSSSLLRRSKILLIH